MPGSWSPYRNSVPLPLSILLVLSDLLNSACPPTTPPFQGPPRALTSATAQINTACHGPLLRFGKSPHAQLSQGLIYLASSHDRTKHIQLPPSTPPVTYGIRLPILHAAQNKFLLRNQLPQLQSFLTALSDHTQAVTSNIMQSTKPIQYGTPSVFSGARSFADALTSPTSSLTSSSGHSRKKVAVEVKTTPVQYFATLSDLNEIPPVSSIPASRPETAMAMASTAVITAQTIMVTNAPPQKQDLERLQEYLSSELHIPLAPVEFQAGSDGKVAGDSASSQNRRVLYLPLSRPVSFGHPIPTSTGVPPLDTELNPFLPFVIKHDFHLATQLMDKRGNFRPDNRHVLIQPTFTASSAESSTWPEIAVVSLLEPFQKHSLSFITACLYTYLHGQLTLSSGPSASLIASLLYSRVQITWSIFQASPGPDFTKPGDLKRKRKPPCRICEIRVNTALSDTASSEETTFSEIAWEILSEIIFGSDRDNLHRDISVLGFRLRFHPTDAAKGIASSTDRHRVAKFYPPLKTKVHVAVITNLSPFVSPALLVKTILDMSGIEPSRLLLVTPFACNWGSVHPESSSPSKWIYQLLPAIISYDRRVINGIREARHLLFQALRPQFRRLDLPPALIVQEAAAPSGTPESALPKVVLKPIHPIRIDLLRSTWMQIEPEDAFRLVFNRSPRCLPDQNDCLPPSSSQISESARRSLSPGKRKAADDQSTEGERDLIAAFDCLSQDSPMLAHQVLLSLIAKSRASLLERGLIRPADSGYDSSGDESHSRRDGADDMQSTHSDHF